MMDIPAVNRLLQARKRFELDHNTICMNKKYPNRKFVRLFDINYDGDRHEFDLESIIFICILSLLCTHTHTQTKTHAYTVSWQPADTLPSYNSTPFSFYFYYLRMQIYKSVKNE